jgi:translation initiation factor IF-2
LGGTTPMIEISAKKGTNVKELLELVVLTADLQDLKAPFQGKMKGVVIESHMHKGSGALATVLVKQGILHQGDALVAGTIPATARILENERMEHVKKAEPSQPIRVVGFKEVPSIGVIVEEVNNIKEAREICQRRLEEARKEGLTSGSGLVEAAKSIHQGKLTELKIILKADVAGSLEALRQSIEALGNRQVGVDVIRAGVGPVNESDIEMATASKAVIVSFRMSVDRAAQVLAKQNNIKISNYDIIYQLLDDLKTTLKGLQQPKIIKEKIGQAKVLKVFFSTKQRKIAGCRISSGRVTKKLPLSIKRAGEEIGLGEVDSLKVEDREVETVKSGTDCGIGIKTDVKLKQADILEFYQEKRIIEKIR